MHPIKQIIHTKHPHGTLRDSYHACLASVFELELKDIPSPPSESDAWTKLYDEWLWDLGIDRLLVLGDTSFMDEYKLRASGLAYVVTGPNPAGATQENGRPLLHAVVAVDGEFVHDPHPSNNFILPAADWEYDFFTYRTNPKLTPAPW